MALVQLLRWILSIAKPTVPTVHLLGSAYTPAHNSTLSQYAGAELPLANGYAPQAMPHAATYWTLSGLPAGGLGTCIVMWWTVTVPFTVYGYYVSDDSSGVSLWGELLATPQVYGVGGGTFALQLSVSLTSQPGVS